MQKIYLWLNVKIVYVKTRAVEKISAEKPVLLKRILRAVGWWQMQTPKVGAFFLQDSIDTTQD